MPYRIVIPNPAKKDIGRLDPPVQQAAREAIRGLKDEPRPVGYGTLRGEVGYRIKFLKDYRIVYDVDDATQTVTILKVRHRSIVYKRR